MITEMRTMRCTILMARTCMVQGMFSLKNIFLEDQFSKNCNWCFAFRVVVEHARGPRRDRGRDRRRPWVDKYGPPTRTDYRLIIENLSTRVSWQDLKDLMRRAGEVTYANAHNDNRNEGYIIACCTCYFLDSIFSKILRFFSVWLNLAAVETWIRLWRSLMATNYMVVE